MGFLDPAINSAFDMIKIANQELGTPAKMDDRMSSFTGYIFGENNLRAWGYAHGNYFRPFKTRRYGLANEYQDVFKVLDRAGRNADIIIYCDQTRLQQNAEGHWVDKINKRTFSEEDADTIERCEQEGKTAAWTVRTRDSTLVIQLCPWYMKQFEGKDLVFITPEALNRIRDPSTPPSTLLIDNFRLLDHTILHEVCITAVSCTD
jgi:hypothetical protein